MALRLVTWAMLASSTYSPAPYGVTLPTYLPGLLKGILPVGWGVSSSPCM
jgi:hypothetical protein